MTTPFDIFIYISIVFFLGLLIGANADRESVFGGALIGITICFIITITRFFTINF